MRILICFCLLSLLLAAPAASAATEAANPVFGYWDTADKTAQIELYGCGEDICGRAHWVAPPRDVEADANNPDPALRHRRICGLTILTGFQPDPAPAQDSYSDGRIYDPHNGSTYHAQMKLAGPDQLDLHGYVLMPILGLSQTWLRSAPKPDCPAPAVESAP